MRKLIISFTFSFRLLGKVLSCAEDHIKGCTLTEFQLAEMLEHPVLYSAVDICHHNLSNVALNAYPGSK